MRISWASKADHRNYCVEADKRLERAHEAIPLSRLQPRAGLRHPDEKHIFVTRTLRDPIWLRTALACFTMPVNTCERKTRHQP